MPNSSSVEPEGADRESTTITYRISGIPVDWDIHRLDEFLREQDPAAIPVVGSLALEASATAEWLTATVTFDVAPTSFSLPRRGKPSTLRVPHRVGRTRITLDVDFLGTTTLFAPPEEHHDLDVLAITGLGGHAFGSFKERSGEFMWLRDKLPSTLNKTDGGPPMARIITYGYESRVAQSDSFANLEDLAYPLWTSLRSIRSQASRKPTLFVAHSLGGLVLKEALIMMAKSEDTDDQLFLKSIHGIAFFGVPHDGMETGHLVPMVGDGPNGALIEGIGRVNSQVLTNQKREFASALKQYVLNMCCFFETRKSPTAQKDEHGKWSMTGPRDVLVTKSSATNCPPWIESPSDICAIHRSHSEMVKFSPHDAELLNVCSKLQSLARNILKGKQPVERRPKEVEASRHFFVPYPENRGFIWRRLILDEVKKHMGFWPAGDDFESSSRLALHGLGGVGKTQTALAYVYWLRQARPDVSVFWVNASSRDRVRQSLTELAQTYQIPGRDGTQLFLQVHSWLTQEATGWRWLMVIDNADDLNEVSDSADPRTDNQDPSLIRWLPDCNHGSYLITTRNREAGAKFVRGPDLLDITKMEDEEANHLLRAKLGKKLSALLSSAALLTLSRKLEHLPLALVQAASYMVSKSISLEDYLELLETGDDQLLHLLGQEFETEGRDRELPRAVAQSFMISFKAIEEKDPFAGELLSLMSMFDRQGIPREFLLDFCERKGVGSTDIKGTVLEAVGVLKGFCLITEDEKGKFDMHRLIHKVAARWTADTKSLEWFEREALLTVARHFPPDMENTENRAVFIECLPHATSVLAMAKSEARSEARALLLGNMAWHLRWEGRLADAEKACTQSIQLREELWGSDDERTLQSLSTLIPIVLDQQREDEALGLAMKVHNAAINSLGDDHHSTIWFTRILAQIYHSRGELGKAERLQSWATEASRRVRGDEDLSTLSARLELANIYRDQDKLDKAAELAEQTMILSEKRVGEDHWLKWIAWEVRAFVYHDQGAYMEAETLWLQALKARQRAFGAEHLDTAICESEMARSLIEQPGKDQEAEELLRRSLNGLVRCLGEDHRDTLHCKWDLARVYHRQGLLMNAEKLMTTALQGLKHAQRENHPKILRCQADLAAIRISQGRFEEAEKLSEEALDIQQRTVGENHSQTLHTMAVLAEARYLAGHQNKGTSMLRDCVRRSELVLGSSHPKTKERSNLLEIWLEKASGVEGS